MVNNNNIPVDLPKTYTVSYFNEAEWNKDLKPEEILKRDELAELEYQDQVLYGPQYGPGNNQSSSAADLDRQRAQGIGLAGAIGTVALTIVCPPAGAAVAATYATISTTAKVVKNLSTDENVKEAAEVFEIGFGTATIGGGASRGRKCLNHSHQ